MSARHALRTRDSMLRSLLRRLSSSRRSTLTIVSRDGESRRTVFEARDTIEAPNWTPDGQWLVFNGSGALFRVRVDGSERPERIETGSVDAVTNDHVISRDGSTVYFTANGTVFGVPFAGGTPHVISNDASPGAAAMQYYVHSVSPDGETLCSVGLAKTAGAVPAIYVHPARGGTGARLTQHSAPVDGPDYAADGQWIYFNGELNATRAGHSQIFRMRTDGSGTEQITRDERVNWFPHPSPDGNALVYLSYPPGTLGHPRRVHVELHVIPGSGGAPTAIIPLFGGQGSINTNSWSPDSESFAYVEYD